MLCSARPTWREVGEFELDELALWAAHLAEEREREDRKQNLRFGTVCSAIALFWTGKNEAWPPERFFPEAPEPIADEDEMKRRLMAWCVATGGTVNL